LLGTAAVAAVDIVLQRHCGVILLFVQHIRCMREKDRYADGIFMAFTSSRNDIHGKSAQARAIN
jgi:hypothetical protein